MTERQKKALVASKLFWKFREDGMMARAAHEQVGKLLGISHWYSKKLVHEAKEIAKKEEERGR